MKNLLQEEVERNTNEDFLRTATTDELAKEIYEWHSAGYTKGRTGLKLNSVMEVVDWLKQNHKK